MKLRRALACCVCCLALPHGFAQQQPAGAGVNWFSREKEAALGARYAEEMRRQLTVIDSPRVTAYLRALTLRLVAQMPDAGGWDWSFTLVTGDSATSTNEPLSAPGGHLFIRAALLTSVQDEAELAGMMAHTAAHVAARHWTRQATRAQTAKVTAIPLVYMGGWGDRQLVPQGLLPFQRQSESEADHLAVQAMAAAGFDPQALHRYLARTQRDPADPLRSGYPAVQERLAAIEQAIAALPPRTYSTAAAEFSAIQEEALALLPAQRREPPSLRR